MVLELWSTIDIIFCHSEPFFAFLPLMDPENQNVKIEKSTWRYFHFTNVYHKWQSYNVWFLRYGVQRTEFFVILDRFLPLYPPNNPKNQNFENMKKNPGDIIILHLCTINDNHMMYGFWDKKLDRQNFFIFLDHFLPFYPPNNPKNKNFEKMKKSPGDMILHKCNINDNHMMYGSWDMEHERQNLLSLWTIFCFFIPLTTWKIKILKNWRKNTWRHNHFTQVSQKRIIIICYTVP